MSIIDSIYLKRRGVTHKPVLIYSSFDWFSLFQTWTYVIGMVYLFNESKCCLTSMVKIHDILYIAWMFEMHIDWFWFWNVFVTYLMWPEFRVRNKKKIKKKMNKWTTKLPRVDSVIKIEGKKTCNWYWNS